MIGEGRGIEKIAPASRCGMVRTSLRLMAACFLLSQFLGCSSGSDGPSEEGTPGPVVEDKGRLISIASVTDPSPAAVKTAVPVLQTAFTPSLWALSDSGKYALLADDVNRSVIRLWDVERGTFRAQRVLAPKKVQLAALSDSAVFIAQDGVLYALGKDLEKQERLKNVACDARFMEVFGQNGLLIAGEGCLAYLDEDDWRLFQAPLLAEPVAGGRHEDTFWLVGIDAAGRHLFYQWPPSPPEKSPEDSVKPPDSTTKSSDSPVEPLDSPAKSLDSPVKSPGSLAESADVLDADARDGVTELAEGEGTPQEEEPYVVLRGWPEMMGDSSVPAYAIGLGSESRLVAAFPKKGIFQWDTQSGDAMGSLTALDPSIRDVVIRPGLDRYIGLSSTGEVVGGLLPTGEPQWKGQLGSTFTGKEREILAVARSGQRAIIRADEAMIVDFSSWHRMPSFPKKRPRLAEAVAWDASGDRLVAAISTDKEEVRRLDAFLLPLDDILKPEFIEIGHDTFPEDGKTAGRVIPVVSKAGLLAAPMNRGVQLYDLKAGVRLGTFPAIETAGMAFDTEGESLFTVAAEGEVRRWEPAGDSAGERITLYKHGVSAVAGSSRHGLLVVGQRPVKGSRSNIEIFAMERHQVVKRLRLPGLAEFLVAGIGGEMVAAKVERLGVRVWELPLARVRATFKGVFPRLMVLDDIGNRLIYIDNLMKSVPVKGRRGRRKSARRTALLGAPARDLLLNEGGKCIFVLLESGEIRVTNSALHTLASLYLFNEKDWLITTPDGHFAGSAEALENLRLTVGSAILRPAQAPDLNNAGQIARNLKEACSSTKKALPGRWRIRE